jgi:glycosyltransferase involved in cell wall biosynthesis
MMTIYWITVRQIGDLCSTTTVALADGLVLEGHSLTVLGPKSPLKTSSNIWKHIELKQSSVRGLKAISLARAAGQWFKKHNPSDVDAVILDWQIASRIAPLLSSFGWPMILMDRSPPADASFLARLQWREWKRSWKLVENQIIARGCVVSNLHSKFIQDQYEIQSPSIHVMPAGVNLQLFNKTDEKILSDGLRFVYHGRLDRHRGVLSLPMLIQKLNSNGITSKLTLIGEGNAYLALKSMEPKFNWIEVHPRMEHTKVAEILSLQHIGLLPMPESKIWKMASPLKRSEYLASGLLVLGTKHAGHQVSKNEEEWMKLFPQKEFHQKSIEWLTQFHFKELSSLSNHARLFAEEHYSWDRSIAELNLAIQGSISEL